MTRDAKSVTGPAVCESGLRRGAPRLARRGMFRLSSRHFLAAYPCLGGLGLSIWLSCHLGEESQHVGQVALLRGMMRGLGDLTSAA